MAGITSLSRALLSQINQKKGDCALVELNEEGRPVIEGGLRFQYFPDSIQDTKATGWNAKQIPGGSLPLYQWTNSGERVISFTAVFTTDVNIGAGPRSDTTASKDDLDRNFSRLDSQGLGGRNIDIRTAILWLRRFTLPRYGSGDGAIGSPVVYPPRKLQLIIKNSGIGLAGGGSLTERDSVRCVMTQCDVTWEAFFPNNLPRIATVNLQFAEIPQTGTGVVFPQAYVETEALVRDGGNTDAPLLAYKLTAKK